MRRGFTLPEVLVALGLLVLVGGVAMRSLLQAAHVEREAALTTGAARLLEFFVERAALGDGRFLPPPGGSLEFPEGSPQIVEALRQGGLNLALASKYRVEVSSTASGSLLRYQVLVRVMGVSGPAFSAVVYGPPLAP